MRTVNPAARMRVFSPVKPRHVTCRVTEMAGNDQRAKGNLHPGNSDPASCLLSPPSALTHTVDAASLSSLARI